MKRYVLKLMKENGAVFIQNINDTGWFERDTSDINEAHRMQEKRIKQMPSSKIWVEEETYQ